MLPNRIQQDHAEVKALASLTLVCQGLHMALVTALVEEAPRALTQAGCLCQTLTRTPGTTGSGTGQSLSSTAAATPTARAALLLS
jgi:hypothetical protein